MAGRSYMVAIALSVFALAASAGCAATNELAFNPSVSTPQAEPAALSSPRDMSGPSSDTLAMVLATEAAAAGPTPVMASYDPDVPLAGISPSAGPEPSPLSLTVRPTTGRGYGPATGFVSMPGSEEFRPLEMQIAGQAPNSNFDIAFAQRAGSNEGPNGRTTSAGAEVRIGQRLGIDKTFESPRSWKKPAWYVFAASDGQALTYTPSGDATQLNRNFRLQDRVNIGDIQAGVSVEAGGIQASLSYVKREVTTMDSIRHQETTDESFTGLTFTWRK